MNDEDIAKRLHLLSTTRYLELHLFISQLQSKLIDIYLDSKCSQQKSVKDFFKPLGFGDTIKHSIALRFVHDLWVKMMNESKVLI